MTRFKWSEWRLTHPGENLFDLSLADYQTYKLICEGYYATRVS